MLRGAGWSGAILAASLSLSCGGDDGSAGSDGDTDGSACRSGESAPYAPTLVDPKAGPLLLDTLQLQSSAFVDADGDAHVASEFEIRRALAGEPGALAWSAHVTDPGKLLAVTLADGSFAAGSALADREEFLARTRHQDTGEGCTWSAWSDWVPFSTDESMYLFDPDRVHTFELEIPPESWGPIDAEAVPPGCVQYSRNYYRGALIFDGRRFEGVGIRSKGGCGSARDLNGKTAFKVKLDWDDPDVPGCAPDRRLFGLDTITLNNGIQDPTTIHERLAYRFYREHDVPAPRAVNARLNVNGEYWGLYVHAESIDRTFLERWYEQSDGMMYEGAYWCDLIEQNVPDTLEGDSCFQREFQHDELCDSPPGPGEDPKDWELLRDLTRDLAMLPPGEVVPGAGAIIDLDRFVTMMAMETVTAHWDGYPWSLNNNYRVYHEPLADRWTILPWGVDQTFEEFDFDPWVEAAGVLSRACLDQPECEAAFAARVHELTDAFELADFAGETNAIREQIRAHAEQDPRKEVDMQEWETLVDDTVAFIETRPDFVRGLLADHGY